MLILVTRKDINTNQRPLKLVESYGVSSACLIFDKQGIHLVHASRRNFESKFFFPQTNRLFKGLLSVVVASALSVFSKKRVTICCNGEPDIPIVALMYLFCIRRKTVLWFDCIEVFNEPFTKLNSFSWRYSSRLRRYFLKNLKKATAVGRGVLENFSEVTGSKIDQEVIYNYRRHWSGPIRIDPQKNYAGMVWVGNPYPQQGLEKLVDLLSGSEIPLTIIGSPPKSWSLWFSNFSRVAKDRDVEIDFVKSLPNLEIPAHVAMYQLAVIPRSISHVNNRLSVPNKFFEYGTSGIPIIGFPSSELSNLYEGYFHFDFDFDSRSNFQLLARKIIKDSKKYRPLRSWEQYKSE